MTTRPKGDAFENAQLPDLELRLIQAVTKRLPRMRGMGRIMRLGSQFYLRKSRPPLVSEVLGSKMRLDPGSGLFEVLLFAPQLLDRKEVSYLRRRIRPGDCFVDVGAHIGFYTLLAARQVTAQGRVIAIEADPRTYETLLGNLSLNRAHNVHAVKVAVSDTVGTCSLGISHENSGRNSLLWNAPEAVEVDCRTLATVLAEANVGRIDAMKLDIEGMEFRVLKHFFDHAPEALWPGLILVEYLEVHQGLAGGDVLDLIKSRGYSLSLRTPMNCILERAR